MKLVFIVYNVAIHEEIMEILEKLDLKSYTRWEEVTGVGRQSGPHLNTHVWPAKNAALVVVAKDNEAQLLMEEIRQLRKTAAREGVKAFCWRVDNATHIRHPQRTKKQQFS